MHKLAKLRTYLSQVERLIAPDETHWIFTGKPTFNEHVGRNCLILKNSNQTTLDTNKFRHWQSVQNKQHSRWTNAVSVST